MYRSRWQDTLMILVGIYVFFAPFIIQYYFPGPEAPSSLVIGTHMIIGVGLIVLSLLALFRNETWEDWGELLLGLSLIASPWIFAYANATMMTWSAVVAGVVIGVLSVWTIVETGGSGGQIA